MSRGQQAQRRFNREYAWKHIKDFRKLADVQCKDIYRAHWVITLKNKIRIDYWPSTYKWRSEHSGPGNGSVEELFLLAEKETAFDEDRHIIKAERTNTPEPGINVYYSNGEMKFNPDTDRETA